MRFLLNLAVSATLISVAALLSRQYPRAAGFLIALPLATMITLPLAWTDHRDLVAIGEFAKSISIAVPITLFFLLPFVFAARYGLSFWLAYALACAWLVPGFWIHRYVSRLL